MRGIKTSHSFSLSSSVTPPICNFSQQQYDISQDTEKRSVGLSWIFLARKISSSCSGRVDSPSYAVEESK